MTIEEENYFPRGGYQADKTGAHAPGQYKKRKLLFQNVEKKKKSKMGKKERNKQKEAKEQKEAKTINAFPRTGQSENQNFPRIYSLKYENLCTGLKSLCCVKEIHNTHILVSVPGALSFMIRASSISQPYWKASMSKNARQASGMGKTDNMEEGECASPLSSLFKVGQVLCCKVTVHKVLTVGKGTLKEALEVSTDPKDVNADLTVESVNVGDLIQMAVESREDHGYQMYSGVPGIRAFLPAKQVQRYQSEFISSKPLAIGQLVWCWIKKCSSSEEGIKTVMISMGCKNNSKNNALTQKLYPGSLVDVTVAKINSSGIYVRLASGSDVEKESVTGWIEMAQLDPDWSKPSSFTVVGASLKARVLYEMPHTTKFVCLTLKINPLTTIKPKFSRGMIFEEAEVKMIFGENVILRLTAGDEEDSEIGFVPFKRIGVSVQKGELAGAFLVGSKVKCRIVYYDFMQQVYICSMEKEVIEQKYMAPTDVKPGDIVKVTVSEYMKKGKGGCKVTFGELSGYVQLHHLIDAPIIQRPELKIRPGSTHSARVLRVSNYKDIELTLKPTLVANQPLTRLDEAVPGESYYGLVSQVNESSLTVTFYAGLKTNIYFTYLHESPDKYTLYQLVKCYAAKDKSGRVVFSLLNYCSDEKQEKEFSSDEKKLEKKRKYIKASNENLEKILERDVVNGNAEMSLKKEKVAKEKGVKNEEELHRKKKMKKEKEFHEDLEEIENKDNSLLRVTTNIGDDMKVELEAGDRKIKSGKKQNRREYERDVEENKVKGFKLNSKTEVKANKMDFKDGKVKDMEEMRACKKTEIEEAVGLCLGRGDTEVVSLEEAAAFLWEATPDDLASGKGDMSSDDETPIINKDSDESDNGTHRTKKKKMTPAEKKAVFLEKERQIRDKEEELLNIEHEPKAVDHFERLVLGQPNYSEHWVKYMAFHLQGTEIEKARSVARRALKQMNVREENERLNIWVALLNLENLYGTEESFKETLDEALKLSDDYQIRLKVLEIYSNSDKTRELEQLVSVMMRKYKTDMECQLACLKALMKCGLSDKARQCLQKALASFSSKQHVNLLSRFALIENEYGHAVESHALFESVLTSYPSRVDIWFIYVDMLIKAGSITLARQVLERASGQNLVAKKMKSIYAKWLTFEENHGSPELVRQVKEAALEYVNKLTNSEGDVQ